MTQVELPNIQALQTEVSNLREELNMRDQLVQQLSQELFRLVKGNTNITPSPALSEQHLAEMRKLREQLQGVEEQVAFYQEQISERDGGNLPTAANGAGVDRSLPYVGAGSAGVAHPLPQEIQ